MRKVVLYTLMSLDGAVDDPAHYFQPAAPGGPPASDAAMDEYEAALTSTQDAVLLGRRMYDEWSRFWPTVPEEPFAGFINTVKKYVVTTTPLTGEWDNAEPVAGPVEALVRALVAQPGGDIGVHGSIELAQSLLRAGLVDEMHLVVGPAVGFPGRRLFEDVGAPRRVELLSSTATTTGALLLHYRLKPAPG